MTDHSPGAQDSLRADPDVIAEFGTTATGLAALFDAAATRVRDADPSALSPFLGPVGADFLTAFTLAQHGHERDLARLGAILAGMGSAATLTAAGYEGSVAGTAGRVREAGEQL